MRKVALLIAIAVIFTACQTDKTTSNSVNEDSIEVSIDTTELNSVDIESMVQDSFIVE
jgi:PBP1b-binding outer membrane lipoprotein LpoB